LGCLWGARSVKRQTTIFGACVVLSSLQERTRSTHEMPRDDPAENSSNLPAMKRSRSIRSDASSQPNQLRCRPMPESSGMAASQLFARPLVRGRSSLFGSLPGKSRSRESTSQLQSFLRNYLKIPPYWTMIFNRQRCRMSRQIHSNNPTKKARLSLVP
jgi:hypothetical protein